MLVNLVVAYPSYLKYRFPKPTDKFMGYNSMEDGVYNNELVDSNGVTCTKKGLYVVGTFTDVDGSMNKNNVIDGETQYWKYNSNVEQVGSVSLSGTYDVLCANKLNWEYARWDGSKAVDMFIGDKNTISKHVAVIGRGVGGLSAASAIKTMTPEASVVVVGPEYSTTLQSTGVALFPRAPRHNNSFFADTLTAYNTVDKDRMADWFDTADNAFDFWNQSLALKEYFLLNNKPPEYSGLPGEDAYIPGSCNDNDCGEELVSDLSEGLETIDALVEEVTRYGDGRWKLDLATDAVVIADVVVFGTGGNGAEKYPGRTHAASSTNLALKTARALNLQTSGEDYCYYLPWSNATGSWEVQWFPTDNCEVIDCGNVSICDEYQTRGLRMNDTSCATKRVEFECEGSNGEFWRNFFTSINAVENDRNCENVFIDKGVIDCKGAFATSSDLSAVDNNRLYASGTTASAFTGDTYVGPGATIGLGLWTGWRIGDTAGIRALEHARARSSTPTYDGPSVPWFLAGAWLLFLGVAAHVVKNASSKSVWGYLHYGLNSLAVAVIGVAIAVAAYSSGPRAAPSHRTVGWVAFALLLVQVSGGVYLKVNWSKRVGLIHRLSGGVVLCLVAYQYLSATAPNEPLDVYADYDQAFHRTLAIAFTTGVAVIYALGWYYYLRPKRQTIKI